MNVTGYRCMACEANWPGTLAGFICPACGNNLEVRYAYDEVARQPFLERRDMFRYAPLLPLRNLELIPRVRVGQTPLYRTDRLDALAGEAQVWIKDDGQNPSASLKDRAGAVALAVARERGASVIAGATTGNAGSSLACLAASVGLPCVIFLPEKAPPAKIAQLLVFGAKVVAVRGNYDQAFDLCDEVCRARGWFNRNTGSNPFTREGKKTCSFEVWEQLGRRVPDWMVVCTGDGNILSGIWKGWRELKALGLIKNLPRLVCAQSEQSAAISQAVRALQKKRIWPRWSDVTIAPVQATTLADSISVDVPRDGLAAVRAVIESGGAAVTVPDQRILEAIPQLARATGVFAEPAAAASWACLKQLAMDGILKAGESAVCLISGHGLKDVASARRSVGDPVVIDPNFEAAQRAVDQLLG